MEDEKTLKPVVENWRMNESKIPENVEGSTWRFGK